MSFISSIRFAVVAAVLALASPANAISVTATYTKSPNFTTGQTVATVTCGGFCLGWDGSGWSSTVAAFFAPLSNASPTTELNALNNLLGTSFVLSDFTRQNNPGNTFTVNSLYTLVKTGLGFSVFKNLAANVTYVWTPAPGTGTGVSHVSSLGVVPVPPALFLLGGALAGLGLFGRRRRASGPVAA